MSCLIGMFFVVGVLLVDVEGVVGTGAEVVDTVGMGVIEFGELFAE